MRVLLLAGLLALSGCYYYPYGYPYYGYPYWGGYPYPSYAGQYPQDFGAYSSPQYQGTEPYYGAQQPYGGAVQPQYALPDSQNCGTPDEPKPCTR